MYVSQTEIHTTKKWEEKKKHSQSCERGEESPHTKNRNSCRRLSTPADARLLFVHRPPFQIHLKKLAFIFFFLSFFFFGGGGGRRRSFPVKPEKKKNSFIYLFFFCSSLMNRNRFYYCDCVLYIQSHIYIHFFFFLLCVN